MFAEGNQKSQKFRIMHLQDNNGIYYTYVNESSVGDIRSKNTRVDQKHIWNDTKMYYNYYYTMQQRVYMKL